MWHCLMSFSLLEGHEHGQYLLCMGDVYLFHLFLCIEEGSAFQRILSVTTSHYRRYLGRIRDSWIFLVHPVSECDHEFDPWRREFLHAVQFKREIVIWEGNNFSSVEILLAYAICLPMFLKDRKTMFQQTDNWTPMNSLTSDAKHIDHSSLSGMAQLQVH